MSANHGPGPQSLPVPALFPQDNDRRDCDDRLTHALSEAKKRVASGAVNPTLNMDDFRQQLTHYNFAAPRQITPVLTWVIEQLEHGVVQITHPRYFGLFNPAPTFPAQCADRIVAAFNPQLATFTTSPVAVEIEDHVIRSVARRAGLPSQATGHFTSGGAEANYTALILALNHANPAFASDGARAFAGRPVSIPPLTVIWRGSKLPARQVLADPPYASSQPMERERCIPPR